MAGHDFTGWTVLKGARNNCIAVSRGPDYINIRSCFQADDGNWYFTKAFSFGLKNEQANDFIDALNKQTRD